MRLRALILVVLAVAGCGTKQNPNVCCVSDADCDSLGIPRETGCAEGLACKNHTCGAPDCTLDTDCPADSPVCHDGVCFGCDDTHACGPGAPVCELTNTGANVCSACIGASDCAAQSGTAVCDTTSGACVECVASMDCDATRPVCDTSACRGCTQHNECASNACLPDGTCGTDADTAYVDPLNGTTNSMCTHTMPCSTIAGALATMRPNVKLTGNINEPLNLTQRSTDTTFIADRGTTITNANNPVINVLEGLGGSNIRIFDLTVSGGSGDGLECGRTTQCPNCSVLLDRVVVVNNDVGVDAAVGCNILDSVVANNRTIGIRGGASSIINNIIARNGNATNGGGIQTNANQASNGLPPLVIEFNTIADNVASDPARAAIDCLFGCSETVNIRNNIISHNGVGPNYSTDFCLFDSGIAVSGTNKAGDPKFLSTNMANPRAPDFYRIGAQSAAIDAADPASSDGLDIDGDARPQGPRRDIGADEFK